MPEDFKGMLKELFNMDNEDMYRVLNAVEDKIASKYTADKEG